MKKLWLGILALVAATTARGAIVTVWVSVHESPAQTVTTNNQFAVWATVSNDNGGLYAYGIDTKTTGEGGIVTTPQLVNRTPIGSWDIDDNDPNFDADYANSPTGGYPTRFGGFGTGRGVSATPGTDGTVSGVQDLAKGANLVKLYHAGQPGFGGKMDVAGPKPADYIYPPGAQRADGTPLTGTVPFKPYVSAEPGADGGGGNTIQGGRSNMAFPPAPPPGRPVIPSGSIRLFTGAWTGASSAISSASQVIDAASVNTIASVWHDTSGAEVFDNATIQLAFRDLGGGDPFAISIGNTAVNTNQAVGGSIAVAGLNNKYSSEVDQLLDPSVSRGSANIQTIGDEAGFLWLMAKVTGTASDVSAITGNPAINNGQSADAATAAALHAAYDSRFAGGSFNLLYRQANIVGAKNVNWDFSANPGAVMDQLAVVPEPATMGLMSVAGLGLLVRRRRAALS